MGNGVGISDQRLLALYDAALPLAPHGRAALVVAEVLPPALDGATLTLGDRDRLLWAFKRAKFGPRADAVFDCAACSEAISFSVPADFELPEATASVAEVRYEGRTYVLKLPVAGVGTLQDRICADAPWERGDFRKKAAAALDKADPGMDVVFDIACPECGAENPRGFDAFAFLWRDLIERVERTFSDVALLARAFGWTEAETLALPPYRRARYVEMVQ